MQPSYLSRAIITCWVISTLTAMFSELAAVALVIGFESGLTPSDALRALAMLVVLTALFSGALGLIFLPLALRVADVNIPRTVSIVSLLVCLLPWLVYLMGMFPASEASA